MLSECVSGSERSARCRLFAGVGGSTVASVDRNTDIRAAGLDGAGAESNTTIKSTVGATISGYGFVTEEAQQRPRPPTDQAYRCSHGRSTGRTPRRDNRYTLDSHRQRLQCVCV